jgi:hypothetical protein
MFIEKHPVVVRVLDEHRVSKIRRSPFPPPDTQKVAYRLPISSGMGINLTYNAQTAELPHRTLESPYAGSSTSISRTVEPGG